MTGYIIMKLTMPHHAAHAVRFVMWKCSCHVLLGAASSKNSYWHRTAVRVINNPGRSRRVRSRFAAIRPTLGSFECAVNGRQEKRRDGVPGNMLKLNISSADPMEFARQVGVICACAIKLVMMLNAYATKEVAVWKYSRHYHKKKKKS